MKFTILSNIYTYEGRPLQHTHTHTHAHLSAMEALQAYT